jgi:hypothetical protein
MKYKSPAKAETISQARRMSAWVIIVGVNEPMWNFEISIRSNVDNKTG